MRSFASLCLCASDDDYQDCVHDMTMLCFQVGVVLGLILVPNGKYFGKMLGDEYSRYEPQLVYKGLSLQKNTIRDGGSTAPLMRLK